MIESISKMLLSYEAGLLPKIIKKYYYWACNTAKKKIGELSIENAVVKLDFRSLNIVADSNFCNLYINLRDEGLSADLYRWGIREPLNTYTLFNFIKEEKIDSVLDIGSNIGYFPLVELAAGAKEVVCIEPVPETFLFLKRNINRFKNSRAFNFAIGDETGKIRMYIPNKLNLATCRSESFQFIQSEVAIIEVDCLSLEDSIQFCGLKNKSVLIRMDVEGFEENILKSIPKEVYGISLELHEHILGYEKSCALINRLYNRGYKIEICVRELMGYIPVIKLLGIKRALQFYERITKETRIIYEPSMELIKQLLKMQCNPYLYFTKK